MYIDWLTGRSVGAGVQTWRGQHAARRGVGVAVAAAVGAGGHLVMPVAGAVAVGVGVVGGALVVRGR